DAAIVHHVIGDPYAIGRGEQLHPLVRYAAIGRERLRHPPVEFDLKVPTRRKAAMPVSAPALLLIDDDQLAILKAQQAVRPSVDLHAENVATQHELVPDDDGTAGHECFAPCKSGPHDLRLQRPALKS